METAAQGCDTGAPRPTLRARIFMRCRCAGISAAFTLTPNQSSSALLGSSPAAAASRSALSHAPTKPCQSARLQSGTTNLSGP